MHPRVSLARAAIALATAAALAIAGCSSSPARPKPASTRGQISAFEARNNQLIIAIISCFYRHHLIRRRAADGRGELDAPRLPVHDGQVATSSAADRSTVLLWFASIGGTLQVKGVSMGAWLGNSAMDPVDWPTSICGPIPPSRT